jgi:hypothetical protein
MMYLKIYDTGTVSYFPLPAVEGMEGLAVLYQDGTLKAEEE